MKPSEFLLSGVVFGKDLSNPLIGANVYLVRYGVDVYEAGNPGTVTKLNPLPGGFDFLIDTSLLAVGLSGYGVQISYVGYKTVTMGINEIEDNPWIILIPGIDLQEVVITPEEERPFNWLLPALVAFLLLSKK